MLILILKIIFQHVCWGGYHHVVKLLTVSRFCLIARLKLWILECPCFILSLLSSKTFNCSELDIQIQSADNKTVSVCSGKLSLMLLLNYSKIMSRIVLVILITLKVLNFMIFVRLCNCEKFQNHKVAKVNTCKINYMSSFRLSFPWYLFKVWNWYPHVAYPYL